MAKLTTNKLKQTRHTYRNTNPTEFLVSCGFKRFTLSGKVKRIEHECYEEEEDGIDHYFVDFDGGARFGMSIKNGAIVYLKTYGPVYLFFEGDEFCISATDDLFDR